MLKTKVTGDVTTYSLNFNNLTLSYLNLINDLEVQKRKFPKEIVAVIQRRISKRTFFFILIVFGSYAKNTPTKTSDLDITVIVDTDHSKKEIIPLLETIKRREIKNIDYHIFTAPDFLEMLNTDYENVGKQIYKTSIICHGFIEWCELIQRRQNE